MGKGGQTRRARPWAALAASAALVVPAAAEGGLIGDPPPEKLPKAQLKTTGNNSELKRAVPISVARYEKERVAMSLPPEKLPRLRTGDRIQVSGEVQVSTTCLARGKRCLGRRYEFNPFVTGRIVLAGAQAATAPALALSGERQVKCTQRRPQRNHHCTIAFPNLEATIGDPATLPCTDSNRCYVNMLVGSWHRKAKRGNRVVLGADLPEGGVKQDKGRLNVVHTPAEVPGPTSHLSGDLVNTSLPLREQGKAKRRVVHSIPVPAPRRGEVLAVDGGYLATIDPIPYNTFIATRIVVGDSPTATVPSEVAKQAIQFRGSVTEANGFNCTQGASGFRTPCTVEKAGAIRVNHDAVDPATGQPATVFVNLVGSAKPLLYPMQHVKRWHQVQLSPVAGMRLYRYTPPAR